MAHTICDIVEIIFAAGRRIGRRGRARRERRGQRPKSQHAAAQACISQKRPAVVSHICFLSQSKPPQLLAAHKGWKESDSFYDPQMTLKVRARASFPASWKS